MIQHFPVLSVMVLFFSAFLIEIVGKNEKIRNLIAFLAVTASLIMLMALIPTVMIDGQVISYWMGGWTPESGYAIGIGYEVDALSLLFALLGIVAYWLSCVYSFGYMKGKQNLGHYYTLFLMLAGSSVGFFLTGDIFNMFIMMEIVTFSAVALTAANTEKLTAIEGAFKYLVNCSIGSSMTLAGIALLYMSCHTLNLAQLASMLPGNMNNTTLMAFALILTGFCVESAMIPFHASFVDAHTVAPSSVSMILSGMVLKLGVYGIIRISYIVFRAIDTNQLQIMLTAVGTVTMFMGVTMALAQHDFKRLLAFHSVSQLGYIITAAGLCTGLGLNAALFHAVNHTLFKGLLFLCAGAVIHSTGTSDLDSLGGLSKKMPKTCLCFLVGAFSISGLPPFNGFVSKWLIYQAVYDKAVETGNFYYVVVVVTALIVSVMTLASFVKVLHSVFFGQLRKEHENVKEVPPIMLIPMIVMSLMCLFTGLCYREFDTVMIRSAVSAAFNNLGYVDSMMGEGYSVGSSLTGLFEGGSVFSYWDPYVWLVLFLMIFAASILCFLLMQNTVGRTLKDGQDYDSVYGTGDINVDFKGSTYESADPKEKYEVFFSGEKAEYSHAGGSDLFWGFKYNWHKYYEIMQGLHSGSVNDYSIYAVIMIAILCVFMFAFMH
ncbi:MAG: hypothetical protein K6E33_00430 [Lachnospiraceae bacterium]|nr:hypothetical protein [Lachnospiraceae bacterium]